MGELFAFIESVFVNCGYRVRHIDDGKVFELSDDPLLPELKKILEPVTFGRPESVGDNLKPILSNASIFGVNLYDLGIGTRVEELVREMLSGEGAVRRTLQKYLN